MPITYVSPHHSAEDPGGLIRESLDLGTDFPGPAEDLLLAWTLRLAPELPAQEAARTLLRRYGLEGEEPEGPALRRLVALLRETAETGTSGRARRRGGWRGRRS